METNRIYLAYTLALTFVVLSMVYLLTLDVVEQDKVSDNSFLSLRVLQGKKDNDSWFYYEIHYADSLLIRQNFVPGIAGQVRFKTRENAERVGSLVLKRLNVGNSPVVTVNDLRNIGYSIEK
ncbi:MAG: DUF4907 domain-containing protein [Bacteroidota bacterium]